MDCYLIPSPIIIVFYRLLICINKWYLLTRTGFPARYLAALPSGSLIVARLCTAFQFIWNSVNVRYGNTNER
jgi:hypothetical protein